MRNKYSGSIIVDDSPGPKIGRAIEKFLTREEAVIALEKINSQNPNINLKIYDTYSVFHQQDEIKDLYLRIYSLQKTIFDFMKSHAEDTLSTGMAWSDRKWDGRKSEFNFHPQDFKDFTEFKEFKEKNSK